MARAYFCYRIWVQSNFESAGNTMNTLLVSINSKYIHSNLAIRYLKAYTSDICNIQIAEFTINQRSDAIAAEIFRTKADVVGFSAYIWNIDQILDVARILSTVSPNTKILLGGPEVSYDPVEILEKNPFIDMIIYGEGEQSFRELLSGVDVDGILGIAFNRNGEIIINPERPLIRNLDEIPFPYLEEDKLANKIVYYEATRGCPFNCSFCLSSTIKGVRSFSLERIKKDLDFLISSGARQVKFVDRTFNANKNFAKQIMEYIADKSQEMTSFHVEITAHLIDEEQLHFYKGLRDGLFQFEIGVQSTHPDTIDAIGRTTDFEKLREVTRSIAAFGNIHQHLDLIAGLPYEGYERFGESFDDLFDINPEKIQLGFLKLLKGSKLREEAELHGYKFQDKAPYEILESRWMSYEDLIRLKDIEELVEKYYNEKLFKYSLAHLAKKYFNSPFGFFERYSYYWREKKHYEVSHSRESLYTILHDFCIEMEFEDLELISDLIRLDHAINSNRGSNALKSINTPFTLEGPMFHELFKKTDLVKSLIPDELESSVKDLLKRIRLEHFNTSILQVMDREAPFSVEKSTTVIMIYRPIGKSNVNKVFDITKFVKEVID